MPKSKEQKRSIAKELNEKIDKAKSVVFVNFSGLTVKENETLRGLLKKEDSEYYVAKKTLLRRVLKDASIDINAKEFEGQIAAIFGYGDEVAPAKVINGFKKGKEDNIKFAGGILENKFIPETMVAQLAILPSKQELYAKIVGLINAPVSGLVNVLAGNLRNLVYVLSAVKDKK